VVEISNYNLNMLAISSFRYALGRMTYIVGETADFLNSYKDQLTPNTKALIIREIEEAKGLGMKIDEEDWLRLRDILKQES
jgi:hypothetical protein